MNTKKWWNQSHPDKLTEGLKSTVTKIILGWLFRGLEMETISLDGHNDGKEEEKSCIQFKQHICEQRAQTAENTRTAVESSAR